MSHGTDHRSARPCDPLFNGRKSRLFRSLRARRGDAPISRKRCGTSCAACRGRRWRSARYCALQGGTTAAKGSAPAVRGCSSDGRALQSHCRGQGFDSPQLHHARRSFRPVPDPDIAARTADLRLRGAAEDGVSGSREGNPSPSRTRATGRSCRGSRGCRSARRARDSRSRRAIPCCEDAYAPGRGTAGR